MNMFESFRNIRWTGVLTVALVACGGDDSDDSSSGSVKKGDDCTSSSDCEESPAVCIRGAVCSGAITSTAFTTECASGGAADCAGLACIGLKENVQGKSGICSMGCAVDADCLGAPLGVCVDLGSGSYCLKPCSESSDCDNGFVCVADPGNAERKACLVEAV
jgi:hypothetical protein